MKKSSTWAVTCLLIVLSSCGTGEFGGYYTPHIHNFTPATGKAGDTVMINGYNFSEQAAGNVVMFNGTVAEVLNATFSKMTVKVPTGATTGKISLMANGKQAISANIFTVDTLPVTPLVKDIPRSGLVAFYGCFGNARDTSGNAHHLVASSNVSLTTDRFGVANQAYHFAGGHAGMGLKPLNNNRITITHPFTVSVWMKYDSIKGSIHIENYSNQGNGFSVSVRDGGELECNIDNMVFYSSSLNMPATTGGQWICMAYSYDGATVRLYKNGVLVETMAKTGTVTASGYFRVYLGAGIDPGGPYYFECALDDIALYNKVLSDTEIKQLFDQTFTK
jgi:hypothetical protein